MPPRKRETGEIRGVMEPRLDAAQRSHYLRGIALFNEGRFWHAHESWEAAWLPMGDGPEDDGEIFLRALIQLASGLHLRRRGRYAGARSQLAKATAKFAVLPPRYLGLDVVALRVFSRHQLVQFQQDFTCRLRLREE
ncbi:MAG: DUF309 domain-containing protein [Bacteroidota bacterium]|jgi:predicted metal-dependent hydrolase|nr:DUF309 domain-containing protein [Bacteroidota bacterium]